jgi:hypothetical protein
MGLEKFKSGGTTTKSKDNSPSKNPGDMPPIGGEQVKYCPECVEESEWDGRAYSCPNDDCPVEGFILGFDDIPFFGAPLLGLPLNKQSEGKRNRLYGGKVSYQEIKRKKRRLDAYEERPISSQNKTAEEVEEEEEEEDSMKQSLENWIDD